MEKGDILEFRIEDMTEDGKGIGRVESLVIFAEGGVPGDLVKAEIIKVKKRYAIARVSEIIEESEDRVNPSCPYFGRCGGCSLLNLSYEKQLAVKHGQLTSKLVRIAGIEEPVVREMIPAEQRSHYRNKGTYAVSKDGKVGFYMRGSDRIIDCESCELQNEASQAVAGCVRALLRDKLIIPFGSGINRHGKHRDMHGKQEKKGAVEGSLRGFTVKACEETGEVMVLLEIFGKEMKNAETIVYALEDALDITSRYYLKSVVLSCVRGTDKHSEIERYKVFAGSNTVMDEVELCGSIGTAISSAVKAEEKQSFEGKKLKFEISAPAFYQVNTGQMKKLYEKAADYANLTGEELLFDLYCGIGTIGLSLADKAKFVIGIENVKGAVLDANRNATINGIVNAIYYTGKAEEKLETALEKLKEDSHEEIRNAPRIAIVDPPRAGCDENLLMLLVESKPERIVYISCDTGTLARDIKYLTENGYEFVEATPVDMFPNTMGIESVTLLSKV